MVGVRRTHDDQQAGLTLVELLVTMVILGIVSTMLLVTWFALQSSYAQTVGSNNARSSARDALNRMSREVRSAQPLTLSTSGQAVFTLASPTVVGFYSSFNVSTQQAAGSDRTSTGALHLSRIYLDGTQPYQTLYLAEDTDNDDFGNTDFTPDSSDRQIALATNVVNNSYPSTGSPTPIFTYGFRDPVTGNFRTANTIPTTVNGNTITLAMIVSVNIRVIVDANLNHAPSPVDLQTLVRPQNASQN